MKITKILYRQHIDRMFKFHWKIQGQRVLLDTKAEKELLARGIPVLHPQEITAEKREKLKLDIVGLVPKPINFDKTHPDWHDNVCYFYRNNNVLLEGIDQAKIITNTVELNSGLPETFRSTIKPNKEINNKVLSLIKSSLLFDTQQEALPKVKDPTRPMFNFPRILGITNARKNQLLISKLLQFCENISDKVLSIERTVLDDATCFVPLKINEDLIQLELCVDKLLLSSKPLDIITTDSTTEVELPNIYPIKYTNTLMPEHIYQIRDLYPVNKKVSKYHPHTVFVYHDHTRVQNIFEEEVTECQILGRSLMKTFSVAASYAKQKFGSDVNILPQPVTLQCVQTDGHQFLFAILQLNTLGVGNGDVKNIWYSMPRISLFDACLYKTGLPVIEGYNADVIKYLLAFYNNF